MAMEGLVAQAMEEGALGLTTALIYAPNTYARTPELIDLAKVSARCGGIYIAHIRNESGGLLGAIQESIDIAQARKLLIDKYNADCKPNQAATSLPATNG